jgi:N-acylneuraminate cytidylyltransferase
MIAIIPARGGSKRIPRKNTRVFFGVPILAHTIKEIQDSNLFDLIVVSTEDEEISQIATSAGAKVLSRDPKLADDFTSTVDVIASAVAQLRNLINLEKEIICCVYPVTPTLKKEYLLSALEILKEDELDYVFTAKRFHSPPARALIRGKDGRSEMQNPKNLNTRTQDLPELFHDAALFYMGKAQAWLDKEPILNGNSKFLEVGKYETQDVDDEQDWKMMIDLYMLEKNSREHE